MDPKEIQNKPQRYFYNKDLFYLKNGNTEERQYVLSLYKIHVVPFPEEDLQEKMKRWIKKEFKTFNEEARMSIQHWKDSWHKRLYKINHRRVRANPEEYFSNHKIVEVIRVTTKQYHVLDFLEQIIVMSKNNKLDSFSKADFKYLNKNDIEDLRECMIRDRKLPDQSQLNCTDADISWVMYLVEIVKFCYAMLERVLNEVKLKIFEIEFLKKDPLLVDLDLDIMKAYRLNQEHIKKKDIEAKIEGVSITRNLIGTWNRESTPSRPDFPNDFDPQTLAATCSAPADSVLGQIEAEDDVDEEMAPNC
ncbi:hypothetical protein Tco_0030795 [Tanacetum coccineum]